MAKKGFSCSIYCMQVAMCAMGFWLLISNVFFYVMFPTSEDDYLTPELSDEDYVRKIVNNFLTTAKKLNWPIFLADVAFLSAVANHQPISWASLVDVNTNDLRILHVGILQKNFNCDTVMDQLEQFTCIYGSPNVVLEPHVLKGRQSFYIKLLQFELMSDAKPPYYLVNSFMWGRTLFEPFKLNTIQVADTEWFTPIDVIEFVRMAKENRFLTCNTTRAEQFYLEFPEQKRLRDEPESMAFQRNVRNILGKVTTAFAPLKVFGYLRRIIDCSQSPRPFRFHFGFPVVFVSVGSVNADQFPI